MSHNQRGVGLFMLAGSVLAVVIGLAVWNTSTPQRSVTAGYTQEAEDSTGSVVAVSSPQRTQTHTTRATSSRNAASKSSVNPPTKRRRVADAGHDPSVPAGGTADDPYIQAAPAQGRYRVEDDPLAPPHAVTSQPQTLAPTTRYRPTNDSSPSTRTTSTRETPDARVTDPETTAPSPIPPKPTQTETSTPTDTLTSTPTPSSPVTPVTQTPQVEPQPDDERGAPASEHQPSTTSSEAEAPSLTPTSEPRSDAESDEDEENLGGLLPG